MQVVLTSSSTLKNRVEFIYDTDVSSDSTLITSKIGDVFLAPSEGETVLFVGMGNKKDNTISLHDNVLQKIQENKIFHDVDPKSIQALYNACKRYKWTEFKITLEDLNTIERLIFELHKFYCELGIFKKEKETFKVIKIEIEVPEELIPSAQAMVSLNEIISHAVNHSRYLASLPSNICNIDYLIKEAQSICSSFKKMQINHINHAQMKNLDMNCHLAVGKGSSETPCVLALEYMNDDLDVPTIVITGKGITYDTGGLSLKSTSSMIDMSYDMAGAGSVLAIMKAIAKLDLQINIVGVIALAENSVDSNSYKPGDIIRSMSGQYVEVGNTDAEGRLILCDTITYVQRNYNTSLIINLATLTGATLVGLGDGITPIYSNNLKITEEMLAIAVDVKDILWPMPLFAGYDSHINSDKADISNVSTIKSGYAGSITAAMFLKRFIETECDFIHLDIARYGSGGEKHISKNSDICIKTILHYLIYKNATPSNI